jgi:hypothetical protein
MFFSRAALEWLTVSGKQPDIIHLHDWSSAAVVSSQVLPLLGMHLGIHVLDGPLELQRATLSSVKEARHRKTPQKAHSLCCGVCPCCLRAQAPLLAEEYRGRGLSRPRCVFTIHNIVRTQAIPIQPGSHLAASSLAKRLPLLAASRRCRCHCSCRRSTGGPLPLTPALPRCPAHSLRPSRAGCPPPS